MMKKCPTCGKDILSYGLVMDDKCVSCWRNLMSDTVSELHARIHNLEAINDKAIEACKLAEKALNECFGDMTLNQLVERQYVIKAIEACHELLKQNTEWRKKND